MFYDNELDFLRTTLKKARLKAEVAMLTDNADVIIDSDITEVFGNKATQSTTVQKYLGLLEEKTVYKSTDKFKLCYIYFILPSDATPRVLFIGPYLSQPLSDRQIIELGEENGISPSNLRYLSEYYSSIPVISESSPLFLVLSTFWELIWDSTSFRVIDVKTEPTIPASPINEGSQNESFDDIIVNMKAMEKRYSFENELMQAVTLGQIHKENIFLSATTDTIFEKRVSDPVRNVKNYCIIINTLLRKAAENGGVHPVYLDKVSSSFAIKIEQLPSVSDSKALMHDMFRSYCRLVRRHSLKNYSLVVQKTILLIDSDLAANLSLSTLAENQNVSPGYLSTIFRKETGKTVSAYIREKRMKHATHLLSTTKLQVQTVALHCGIMDMQYFSKIFKKHTGKTPKEYREAVKHSN